jgi:hypothetical protein
VFLSSRRVGLQCPTFVLSDADIQRFFDKAQAKVGMKFPVEFCFQEVTGTLRDGREFMLLVVPNRYGMFMMPPPGKKADDQTNVNYYCAECDSPAFYLPPEPQTD